jgi:hypothetical protein
VRILEFLEKIAGKDFGKMMISDFETIEQLKNIPILNKLAVNLGEKYLEKTVGGQIIPVNDALEVLELCENPAIMPCECRRIAGEEKHCCLNFGLIPELYKKANPDEYMEEISVNKAKRLLREWDKEGLYHVILWGKAPYLTCICNCTAAYCVAYKGRFVSGLKNSRKMSRMQKLFDKMPIWCYFLQRGPREGFYRYKKMRWMWTMHD